MKKIGPAWVVMGSLTAALGLSACGRDSSAPPANLPVRTEAPPAAKKVWTKEDKIAAIQHAPISDAQKKAEIAKVNAGQE